MIESARLLVLGSGTSAGVPIIGCTCAVCNSSDPRDRRLRSSSCLSFVDAGGKPRSILIDTSPDLRQQALTHGLTRCDGILFTHSHFDHTFGLDEVRRFNAVMRREIPIWAEPDTLSFLTTVYSHIFHKERNVNDSFVASLLPRTLEPSVPIDIHGVRFTPLRLLHGKLPIVGFRIEALDGDAPAEGVSPFPIAYLTDVSEIPPESWEHLGGIRTLVLDMLRYKRHPTHFSVDESIAAAERIGAEQTWFVHMTHDIRHAELEAGLPERMALAYDGLEIR